MSKCLVEGIARARFLNANNKHIEKNYRMSLLDVYHLLEQRRDVQMLPTEHLIKMRHEASLLDKKMSPEGTNSKRQAVIHDRLGPNIERYHRERLRIERWNDEVYAYQNFLLDLATNQLNRIWKDIPPKERKNKIENVLQTLRNKER